jgi:hypothetical protein
MQIISAHAYAQAHPAAARGGVAIFEPSLSTELRRTYNLHVAAKYSR